MPEIRRRVPDATLLIVGDGPYRDRLEALAAVAPAGSVVFTGQVSEADLPRYYRAGNVFAMPCRNRLGASRSRDGATCSSRRRPAGGPSWSGTRGTRASPRATARPACSVNGSDVGQVAEAVGSLLADPERAQAMGRAGRARVEDAFAWSRPAEELAGWLRRGGRLTAAVPGCRAGAGVPCLA
mgnify:CR=1 FL=1